MRFPIFSHRSNPAVDRPILRKKLHYIEQLISERGGYWIDDADKRLGIMLRGHVLVTRDEHERSLNRVAGAGFDTAWHIKQSGWAGPLVYQLASEGR